ncbi:hypothetical protein, partial [Mycobacterium kyogaense]|uniref:hypothetical protein n=1 Tax=Mycobacterium kyogaense TaxID=2212479 RepID=UPI001968FA98
DGERGSCRQAVGAPAGGGVPAVWCRAATAVVAGDPAREVRGGYRGADALPSRGGRIGAVAPRAGACLARGGTARLRPQRKVSCSADR